MKIINLSNYFKEFCSDGEESYRFLVEVVIPEFEKNEKISFDFSGIRNMNSSFSNALFANLIRKRGSDIINRISFSNCGENIKILISTSLSMGINDIKKENK